MKNVKILICRITALCLVCSYCAALISCSDSKSSTVTSENSQELSSAEEKIEKKSTAKLTRYFDDSTMDIKESNYCDSVIMPGTDGTFYYISPRSETPDSLKTYAVNPADGSVISESTQPKPSSGIDGRADLVTSGKRYWAELIGDKKFMMHCTDINSGTDKTAEFDSRWGVSSILTDAQQNIYAVTYSDILVFSPELELKDTIDIQKMIDDTGCSVNMIYDSCVNGNGDIFVGCWDKAADTHCIFKLDKNKKLTNLTDIITDMEGSLTDLFAPDDQSVIMCTGYVSTFINKYDSATGETLLRYELNDVQELYGPCSGYDMVYRASDGIYGYSFDNDESTPIVPDDLYTGELNDFYHAHITDGTLYVTSGIFEDTNSHLIKYDTDSNILADYSLTGTSERYSLSCVYTDPAGVIYYLITNRGTGSDGDQCYETSSFSVYKFSDTGEVIKMFDTPTLDYDYTPSSFAADSSGNIIIPVMDQNSTTTINIFSPDGNMTGSISAPDDFFYISIFTGKDGELYTYNNEKIYKIDTQNMEVTQVGECKAYSNGATIKGSGDYDFYYQTDCGIYGYKIKDSTADEIMLWTDTDLTCDSSYTVLPDPDTIIIYGYDYDICGPDSRNTMTYSITKLVKADQARLDELNSREIVTLAGSNLLYSDLRKQIKKFNKTNDKYRICAKDYQQFSEYTEDSSVAGSTRLDQDLIDGNIPDIILLDSNMDVLSYLSKGFLTDMNVFLDSDPDIKREDCYSNVFDAYTFNNKLYCVPASYTADTFAAKTSVSSAFDSWTYEDFFSLANQNPDIPVFSNCFRTDVFCKLMSSYIADYVNLTDHSCDFNNETFIKLLEIIQANTMDENTEEDYMYSDSSSGMTALKDNTALVASYNSMDLCAYHQLVQCYAAEPVSLNGVPSLSGPKNIITSDQCFSVSENSQVKEGAWEFIKQFFTDEYQSSGLSCTPIKRSSFSKEITEITSDPEMTSYSQVTGEQIPPVNDEEIDAYNKYLEKPAVSSLMYTKILSILSDEADIYFSSGCTAAEAASSIQSKVTLYLNELL